MAVLAAKDCPVCGVTFEPRVGNQRNCSRTCSKEVSARTRRAQPGYHRDYYLRTTYGISNEEYDALVAKQDGRCAICQKVPAGRGHLAQLFVDHDHATGEIRELLCVHCNSALGQLRDDPDLALAAAAYLIAHRRP